MEVHKKYGWLAQLAGKKDTTEVSLPYDPANPWWDNPLVVYTEAPPPQARVKALAASEPLQGEGRSSNASVQATLVPQAEITLAGVPACDAIAGTITVSTDALAEFYDGGWTPMLSVERREVTFVFDTRDPLRAAEPVDQQVREVSTFSFRRYVRDHQKWDEQATWPAEAKGGDWRASIDGRGAKMELTAYRYAAPTLAGGPPR